MRCGLRGADWGPDGAVIGRGVALDALALKKKMSSSENLPLPK